VNYESEVIDFLSQKENPAFVLEIADKVEKVKEKLHRDFWNGFEKQLQAKLTEHALTNRWRVQRDQDILGNWGGVSLVPLEPHLLYMHPRLEQSAGTFRLFYGMHWSTETREPLTLPAVSQLEASVKSGQFTGNSWWIGCKFTDMYLQSNDFLVRMSKNLDIVVEDVTGIFFDLIDKYIDLVERANQAISEAATNGVPYP
jgi:hypothetical protein